MAADDRANKQELRRLEHEVSAVLQTFDRAKEWADLTNCLLKLHKTFARSLPTTGRLLATTSSSSSSSFVPLKEVVAKRLAQCLSPAFPAGVHTKALETYALIFQRIQVDGLCRDLALFSSGLFPFFQNAATHVKPLFLHLIDHHYLPLGHRLLPCLPGLLVCLLPGLEDEKFDHYDRVFSTVARLCDCVGELHFMAAMWGILIRSDRLRLPALSVISHKLSPGVPSLSPDRARLLLPEALVWRALECCLEDLQVLVRRAVLDMLVMHFPLQHVDEFATKVRLVRASLKVLSSREWSLTRRLMHWITNETEAETTDLTYFKMHVNLALVESVKLELEAEDGGARLKTLSILVVDTELEQAAGAILPPLIVPVLEYIHRERHSLSPVDWKSLFSPKLTRPAWIWEALGDALRSGGEAGRCSELLELSRVYIDDICKDSAEALKGLYTVTSQALELCPTLLGKAWTRLPVLKPILMFIYTSVQQIAKESIPVTGTDEFANTLNGFLDLCGSILAGLHSDAGKADGDLLNAVELLGKLLVSLCRLCGKLSPESARDEPPAWLSSLKECCGVAQLHVSCLAIAVFVSLLKGGLPSRERVVLQTSWCEDIAEYLWSRLDVAYEGSHAEVVKLLLDLQKCVDGLKPEMSRSVVLRTLSSCSYEVKLAGVQRFVVLWKHAHIQQPQKQVFPEAMNLVMDCLDETEPSLRFASRGWLSAAIHDLPHVLDPPLASVLGAVEDEPDHLYDTQRVLYVFKQLTALLRCEGQSLIEQMQHYFVSEYLLELLSTWEGDFYNAVVDYVDIAVATSLRFLQPDLPTICSTAAEFLKAFLSTLHPVSRAKEVSCLVALPLLRAIGAQETDHLPASKNHGGPLPGPIVDDCVLQSQLLGLLKVVMFKSHAPGPAVSNATQLAVKNVTGGDGGEEKAAEENEKEEQPAGKKQYGELLTRAVQKKRAKLIGLPSLGDHALLFSLLRAGMVQHSAGPAHLTTPLQAFVEFNSFALKYVSSNSFFSVCSSSLSFLTSSVSLHKRSPSKASQFLQGITDIVSHAVRPALEQPDTMRDQATESGGFLTLQAFTDLFSWGGGSGETGGSLEDKLGVITDVMVELVTCCVDAVEGTVLDDSGGAKSPLEELDMKRNSDSIRSHVFQLMDLLFKRCPQSFMQSCLTVWNNCLRCQGERRLSSFHYAICRLDKIRSLLPSLVDASSSLFRHRGPCRESVVLHFTYCFVTRQQHESTWSVLLRLTSLVVSSSRQPVSLLWLLEILLALDARERTKEYSIASKKSKRELQMVMHHVCYIAGRQFHQKLSGAAPHSFDLSPPLPPSVDVVNQSLVHTLTYGMSAQRKSASLVPSLQLSDMTAGNSASVSAILPSNSRTPLGSHFLAGEMAPSSRSTFPPPSRPSVSQYSSLVECNRYLLHHKLTSVISSSDPVELAAHFALSALIVFAKELCELNQRSALTTIFLQALCEDLPSYILPSLHNQSTQGLQYRYLLLSLVDCLPYGLYSSCLPSVKRTLLGVLNTPNFFQAIDRRTMHCYCRAIRRAAMDEGSKLDAIVQIPPQAGVFTSRESELLGRIRQLRRTSFVLYACPRNFFIGQLGQLLERLTEHLKIGNTSNANQLACEVFLCMRVLLLQVSPRHLTPIWPVLLTELIQVLSAKRSGEPHLVLHALKVVDLAALLDLPDFHLYQWMFLTDLITAGAPAEPFAGSSDHAVAAEEESSSVFQPFSSVISQELSNSDSPAPSLPCSSSPSSPPDPSASGISLHSNHNPVLTLSPLSGSDSTPSSPCISSPPVSLPLPLCESSSLTTTSPPPRVPLVTIRTVQHQADLGRAAAYLNAHSVTDAICKQKPDMDQVNRSVENDILELPEELLDLWAPSDFGRLLHKRWELYSTGFEDII